MIFRCTACSLLAIFIINSCLLIYFVSIFSYFQVPRVLTTVSRAGSFRFQTTQSPAAEAAAPAPPEQATPPQEQQQPVPQKNDQQEFRRDRPPRPQRPQRRGRMFFRSPSFSFF